MLQYVFGIGIFVVSVFLVLLVLVQRGRGGGLAGALGGPGGQSAFGTKAGDLFTKITIGVAAFWIFLCAFSVLALRSRALPTFGAGSNNSATADAGTSNPQGAGNSPDSSIELTPGMTPDSGEITMPPLPEGATPQAEITDLPELPDAADAPLDDSNSPTEGTEPGESEGSDTAEGETETAEPTVEGGEESGTASDQ